MTGRRNFGRLPLTNPRNRIEQTASIHDGPVAKLGAGTLLSTGTVSASQFSLFNSKEHQRQPSLEWVIIGSDRGVHFASEGDSGAWVFDTAGCLVGMVVGRGVGPLVTRTSSGIAVEREDEVNQAWHYITPVELLFQDIEHQTGCSVRLPGGEHATVEI